MSSVSGRATETLSTRQGPPGLRPAPHRSLRAQGPLPLSREIEMEKLGPGDEDLIRVASLARQRAYAPYSKYKVGAAVRTKRNKIYSGANVENASYGMTVCAERCAVWAAVAAGETKDYDAIAIVIDDDKLPTPCGACRQVIAEFAPDVRVVLATTGGLRKTTTLTALLPDPFLPENLR